MNNCRYRLVKGDAFNIAFLNIALPIIEDEYGAEKYEITERDLLEFSIGRKDRIPIVRKTFPVKSKRTAIRFSYI